MPNRKPTGQRRYSERRPAKRYGAARLVAERHTDVEGRAAARPREAHHTPDSAGEDVLTAHIKGRCACTARRNQVDADVPVPLGRQPGNGAATDEEARRAACESNARTHIGSEPGRSGREPVSGAKIDCTGPSSTGIIQRPVENEAERVSGSKG